MKKINIIVVGASGKMGQAIIKEILENSELNLIMAIDIKTSPRIGKDAGELMGIESNIKISSDLSADKAQANVLIDFTRPEASLGYLDFCVQNNLAYVLGTTGFSDSEKNKISLAAKEIPICFAPNMSIGVNVLISLVEKATKSLYDDFDIEIMESHHKHKVDAPSGTAIRLGEEVAKASNRNLNEDAVFSREGIQKERQKKDIGFSVVRGGDIVGDHTVLFAGDGERIELTHKAGSRTTFSKGAIKAARFLNNKTKGLFDMFDVLNLKKES
ncbi:MAG: 4-hydroxy-tetrahydrodipicolinate reductase [Nitrosomonadales bacterium]|jgi:4-hydroxy-tetrahydrodipicolinate reductase|nr:4-hydroxy-tetrahydrodipicolinate reductase [Nitrosomonadales bacterium]MBT3917641.1 4-hydroxy-tetrahydrodipicolinate reductase [Nitrosomonadales bacterium]MBT4182957.1 4-hydroxy-tetrahydrodipicolinate reductase [Nitrosomonadales bacterium]MBT4571281.1 4-hydroxy-tetrahydrodipicolinate reductase [Nitrosomonadales bacterium]MBT5150573.1 4-hydroxy-tetrahydrodipicolinate reductase [Nitrosomonadales bacterium]